MTIQTDLFTRPLTDPVPASRRTDPPSSHAAHKALLDTGVLANQRTKVYLALADHQGSTARELAEITGIDRYTASRRLPELEKLGYVSKLRDANMNLIVRKSFALGKESQECVWVAIKKEGVCQQ